MKLIDGRTKDLGGFTVRRVLPSLEHRMVGPFVFFDHMGPSLLPPGKGINVRPHPHIGLATVTYLFEGRIRHRDSLGSDQVIEPGAINWMTAGRGIVHSERAPRDEVSKAVPLHGIQLWVALPNDQEDCDPTFVHHPKESLPKVMIDGVAVAVLLGEAFGKQSPVKIHSEFFYVHVDLSAGQKIVLPNHKDNSEAAIYLVQGEATANKIPITAAQMVIANEELTIEAQSDVNLMWLGGKSVGPRFLDWNFVASSKERLAVAREQWSHGPNPRGNFHPIPGDDQEFIPQP